MAELNHTIVHSRDRRASAAFLAGVLGVEVGPDWGPFTPVHLGNGVSLDFEQTGRDIVPQHYAFLVTDDEFDRGLAVVRDGGREIWADPWLGRPGEINTLYGGRGFYFRDPDGHLLELITAPYGDVPGSE
jgi:catechol 2,3-dioxygenase-like lactoylglutathione lyase family enzyme